MMHRLDDATLEVIAETICGGGGQGIAAPGPQRSQSEIQSLFSRAGVRSAGEASTLKLFVLESLKLLNEEARGQLVPEGVEKIILRLANPQEYERDLNATQQVINHLNAALKSEGFELILEEDVEPTLKAVKHYRPRPQPELKREGQAGTSNRQPGDLFFDDTPELKREGQAGAPNRDPSALTLDDSEDQEVSVEKSDHESGTEEKSSTESLPHERRSDSAREFGLAVEELIFLDETIRKVDAARNHKLARSILRGGLTKSCHLLRFMLADSMLNSAHPKPETWRTFRKISAEGKLADFLNVEREILGKSTDLRSDTLEFIIDGLRHVIQAMVEREGHLGESWAVSLSRLADSVCAYDSSATVDLGWRRFLKRAALAGGGGMVTIVNVLASASAPMAPYKPTLDLSVAVGSWLVSWAATGQLDDWAEGK